ncbi:hypothetical protein [Marivirga sp.]|uniref:hypothetical protein n=1 Tax=Marivirga sp. TaxID=2018662 RepID=UPI002D7E3BC6|nr:hypothetical protein [Marivirga sp.]HET8860835.1 hypothetical protein [Marivirga sp.]
MNPNEKKEILKNLNEKDLRQELIIPLLSKMGYIAPIEYHGTNEKGKDIICFEYDRLNEQRFLAVVAKTGNLTGNAATSAGLMNVVTQVQQAFDNPYEDLYNMRQVYINEVWVVTSGKIVSGAQESVVNTLRKTNLDKQIRIIGDDRLIQLIDTHFSTYWNSNSETKESVLIQRDRLISFVEDLLAANNVEKSTIESVKSSILYSSFTPRLSKNIEGLHISNVSPYSIELSKIDSEYDDFIVSKTYGITNEIFQQAKKHLTYSFFDIEDTIRYADDIMKLTDPNKFVEESQNNLEREYPFHNSYGSASKFLDDITYLEEGLTELRYFKSFLEKEGKLEWVKNLSKSIVDLLPEIDRVINNSTEEEIVFNFIIDEENERILLEYNPKEPKIIFTNNYKRVEPSGFRRNKDGTLKPGKVMERALIEFREFIENTTGYDEDKWINEFEE